MTGPGDSRRRTFGPVVLAGVASAGLAAYAGHQPWRAFGHRVFTEPIGLDRPDVQAVALVSLAAWGVVLVTRGRFRRAVALVAVLAGLAALGLTLHGLFEERSIPVTGWFVYDDDGKAPTLHRTAWGWVALVGATVTTLAALAAFRWAPGWPEMGRKYDAPTGPAPAVPLEERSSIDVWKALDEGRDPTAERPE